MNHELDFLYLCACAVNDVRPDGEAVAQMNPAELYRLAKKHKLIVALYRVLEPFPFDEALKQQWSAERDMAVRKELYFDIECEALFEDLEAMGCRYLPLKGSILKELYPYSAMRQRTDVDILFDSAYSEAVRDCFLACGYQNTLYGVGHDDTYMKPPVYNFEMHRSLFGTDNDEAFRRYFDSIFDRLIPAAPNAKRMQMTNEDFYIYLQAHAWKHFCTGGTGLRFLLDSYVFLRHYRETLDWGRVEKAFEEMGMLEFDMQLRALCDKVLTRPVREPDDALTEEERMLLGKMLGADLFGDRAGRADFMLEQMRNADGQLTASGKARYCANRLFPPAAKMLRTYPFLMRHRWLLPAGYVYRMAVMPWKLRRDFRREMSLLRHKG